MTEGAPEQLAPIPAAHPGYVSAHGARDDAQSDHDAPRALTPPPAPPAIAKLSPGDVERFHAAMLDPENLALAQLIAQSAAAQLRPPEQAHPPRPTTQAAGRTFSVGKLTITAEGEPFRIIGADPSRIALYLNAVISDTGQATALGICPTQAEAQANKGYEYTAFTGYDSGPPPLPIAGEVWGYCIPFGGYTFADTDVTYLAIREPMTRGSDLGGGL